MENLKQLDSTLETYFVKKAPKLPVDIQNLIVTYGPYLLIVGVVLGAVGLLSAFGLSMAFLPYARMSGYMHMYSQTSTLYLVIMGFMLVLEGLAIPGLMKKSKQGWTYMFYATLVGVVLNIVQLNIAGLIIGSGIGLYLLYQVKHQYK